MAENYLLFAGETYYPAGGTGDCCGVFASAAEAESCGLKLLDAADGRWVDWMEIAKVDGAKLVPVRRWSKRAGWGSFPPETQPASRSISGT